jgi:hypothetical protein
MKRPATKRGRRTNGPPINIIQACQDPAIFGAWFRDAQNWVRWFVFLKTVFGLPLDEAELAIFRKHTDRTAPAPTGYLDATLVVGRRGGKSLILATISAFLTQ